MKARLLSLSLLWALPAYAGPATLELQTLDGQPASIAIQGQVKPLVAHFWGTWCPPCLEELPRLEKAYRESCNDEVRLIAVNVGDTPAAIQRFQKQQSVGLPMLRDPGGRIYNQFLGKGLPANLIAAENDLRPITGPGSPEKWRELFVTLGCRGL